MSKLSLGPSFLYSCADTRTPCLVSEYNSATSANSGPSTDNRKPRPEAARKKEREENRSGQAHIGAFLSSFLAQTRGGAAVPRCFGSGWVCYGSMSSDDSAIPKRLLLALTISIPSEIAGVAMQISPRELVAMTSNSGPLRSTRTSPFSEVK